MNCPRTGKEMVEVEIDGVKVDVSTGCGGVFFDNFDAFDIHNVFRGNIHRTSIRHGLLGIDC